MALKGNLGELSMAQVLNLINLARKTGSLMVDENGRQVALYFEEGKLVYAAVDGTDSTLAAALRQSGAMTEGKARAIDSNAGSRSEKELGLLLVDGGYVSEGEILESMRSYILGNVYPLFACSDGQFEFKSGWSTDEGAIKVPLEVEGVITEGIRLSEEWERLGKELPDLDISLEFAEAPGVDLSRVDFSAEEWDVISFVSPRNTLRQIARYHNFSEREIREVTAGLLEAGLVRIIEPEEPAAAGEEESPAPEPNLIQRIIGRIRGR